MVCATMIKCSYCRAAHSVLLQPWFRIIEKQKEVKLTAGSEQDFILIKWKLAMGVDIIKGFETPQKS